MKLLINILRATHAQSTHHFFALDALPLVSTPQGKRLCRILLHHHEAYLQGAVAPDDEFGDFRNHVVHVADQWGGAPATAEKWYRKLVSDIESGQWTDAAYSAGVLSHYFTDPIMPLNTAQSPRAAAYHRPLEWHVNQSYKTIFQVWKSAGCPSLTVCNGPRWLSRSVVQGATIAHRHCDRILDQFDIASAQLNPSASLNDQCTQVFSELFGVAIPGLAQIIEHAADEAREEIPNVGLRKILKNATTAAPSQLAARAADSDRERAAVKKIIREYNDTGMLTEHLPRAVAVVREERAVDRIRENATDQRLNAELAASRVRRSELICLVTTSPPKQQSPPRSARLHNSKQRTKAPDTRPEQDETTQQEGTQDEAICNAGDPLSELVVAESSPEPNEVVAVQLPACEQTDSAMASAGKQPVDQLNELPAETLESNQPVDETPETEQAKPQKHEVADCKGMDSHERICHLFGEAVETMRQMNRTRLSEAERKKAINDRLVAARQRRDAARTAGQIKGPEIKHPIKREKRKLAVPTVPVAARVTAIEPVATTTKTAVAQRPEFPRLFRGQKLTLDSPLADAPSIGPKTAAKLEGLGVKNVGHFVQVSPNNLARQIGVRWVTPRLIASWQDQARLVCDMPILCDYESQLLTNIGCCNTEHVAAQQPSELHAAIRALSGTAAGKKILDDHPAPALEEIANWIANAKRKCPNLIAA